MMRAAVALWLAFQALYATIAEADKCAAPPLRLPIRAVSVAPGTLSRGIPISFGTPYQQIALVPSLQIDNTFIPRYSNSCIYNDDMPFPSNSTRRLLKRDGYPGSFEEDRGVAGSRPHWEGRDWRTGCAELYGGGFNPDLSSTFHDNGTNDQMREDWFKREKYSTWHFVTERFSFADYLETYMEQNEVLPEKRNLTTTFIFPDKGALFGNMSTAALGLTPNSTLLRALYEEMMIPSTSWSSTLR